MNNQRTRLQALYLVAFWSLALALKLPWPIWLSIALASAPALMRGRRPLWRFLVALAATALAYVTVPDPFGVALTAITAFSSLYLTRHAQPSGDRAAMMTLALTATAAFIRPLAAVGFIPLTGLAVLALVKGGETDPATERHRTRLAAYLALAAAAGAVIIGFLASLFPWQLALAGIFTALAYPFVKLLSLLGPLHHPLRHGFHPHVAVPANVRGTRGSAHIPSSLHIGLIAVVVLVILVLIYLAYRHFRKDDETVFDTSNEAGIVRESLGDADVTVLWPRRGGRLSPVRGLVRIRLRTAVRRQNGRHPAETLREWLARTPLPPENQATVAHTYEAIRYGDHDDTLDKRRHVESHWPKA